MASAGKAVSAKTNSSDKNEYVSARVASPGSRRDMKVDGANRGGNVNPMSEATWRPSWRIDAEAVGYCCTKLMDPEELLTILPAMAGWRRTRLLSLPQLAVGPVASKVIDDG